MSEQTPEEIKTIANDITPESELPTHANSTKQAAPALDAGLNSPAPVGDASC